MQLFTPPYLTGNPNRPTITALSSQSPAYGAALTITFGASQGGTLTVQRVVLSRQGGTTHSQHFDERQVGATSALPLAARPDSLLAAAATLLHLHLYQPQGEPARPGRHRHCHASA